MNTPLTDIDTLKQILRKADIQPSRSMGQNFLICSEAVEAAIAAIEAGGEHVTELGAGAGTLTQALAAAGYHVRAIEKDEALAALIAPNTPARVRDRVDVRAQDLKDVAWEWEEPYQLIGNIPYNLSGFIMRRLTQLDPPPTQALLLVQKEVAQRMRAGPPEANLLSVSASLWGEAHELMRVPPQCFWPQPKVSSRLVLLVPHAAQPLNPGQRERVMDVAAAAFRGKRKQVSSTIKKAFELSEDATIAALSGADIDPQARPQNVEKEQWIALTDVLEKKGALQSP